MVVDVSPSHHLRLLRYAGRPLAMRFTFQCQAMQHVSGRVTVWPLDFPELAVHAASLARALEELTLALDDRIARAHPRHVGGFSRASGRERIWLRAPVIKVWGAEADVQASLAVAAVRSPAHRPFTEVQAVRLDARWWVEGKSAEPAAEELLAAQLAGAAPADVLALRPESVETLCEVVVDVTPLRLSDLTRRELELDERAPARAPADADEDDDDDGAKAAERDDWFEDRRGRRTRRAPRAKLKRPPTPTLRRLGVAWHELAADGELDAAWERDAVVEALLARLMLEDPEPVVLVGPTGVGKTAVLHELARRLATAPDARPFFFLDGSRLIAGEGGFGDWQRQTLESFAEARRARAVLCLGHVVALLDAGKAAGSDQNVAQLIAPALAAREVAIVGEATPEEWAQVEQRQQALARSFAVLRVDEPDAASRARLLGKVGVSLGLERGLVVAPAAIAEAASLCERFLPYGSPVGNSVAFLRRLCDERAHAAAARVEAADCLAQFTAETGIPPMLLRDDVPLAEDDVRAFLAARVHGQPAAVARVARVVSVVKANLADRKKPVAVLLFAGPTGVGKTELTKALAELVFGARERMVRLDMGEYAGPDALARLLGDGRQAGHLTAAIRRQPFSVLLFDEFEKAHPAVFDALLGVLGEGRLTDTAGRLTDFRNAIIVLTSNLGADTWRKSSGFSTGGEDRALLAHFRAEAQRFFRPELFNRLDDIVVFEALGAPQIAGILGRELDKTLAREGLRRRSARVVVDQAARDLLVARGFDPRYGARPLKRAIERELVVPVAGWLAEHPPVGAVHLEAGAEDGALTLRAVPLAGAAAQAGSRAEVVAVVERAAELRAEVRRWARARPMQRLAGEVRLFDRLSRQPSFWADRGLADDRARGAAEGRDLAQGFAALEKQVEAIEELAYDAFLSGGASAARELDVELAVVDRALLPLEERLYATLFPARSNVTLTVLPGAGAWAHACLVVDAWKAWAKSRECVVVVRVLVPDAKPAAKKSALEARPAKKVKPRPEPEQWKWLARAATPDDSPEPAAISVTISGGRSLMLLAAEHGLWRFQKDGTTSDVRVAFETGKPVPGKGDGPAELAKGMPVSQIRRVTLDDGRVQDFRVGRRDAMIGGALPLEKLLRAYMRWRVFALGEWEGE